MPLVPVKTQSAGAARYTETIGDGIATGFTITHNLNTAVVVVAVYQADGEDLAVESVTITGRNTVRIVITPAPSVDGATVGVI
jgi:hypothetical protein